MDTAYSAKLSNWFYLAICTSMDENRRPQSEPVSTAVILCLNGWPIGETILSNDFRRSNLLNSVEKTTCSVAESIWTS